MVEANTGSVGWRFSPKDEELISYFLARKISGKEDDVKMIREIDVCKWEPWDLPGQSILKSDDKEWFFFCPRDQKFPSSSRLNRATRKGFWKATGKDRKIRSKKNEIGIKKTLVFHTGRAPKSQRTYWVMHEYRTTLKELDGSHAGQRPFVLCRLFKKDDEFVLDATHSDVGLATPSPISNEQSPMDSKPELLSHQADPSAGQNGEFKHMSAENGKDESFMTPSKDTFYDTESHIQNYPGHAVDPEDIMKSTSIEMQPQPNENFDYLDLFADLDPYNVSLFDLRLLESMGSLLPYHLAANNLYENEDLHLDSDINRHNDYTYNVLQSLLTNHPDNSCENQGDSRISTVDYETPNNDHMDHYEIPCMGAGSYLRSNAEEAELSKYVTELEQYAFNAESNDFLQASKLQVFGSTRTSFQELGDESQTHPEYQAGAFSGGSVLEHCVFSDEKLPGSHANLSTPDHVANSGIEIRDRRQLQSTLANSNFDKHGTAQRRIHLQINPGRKSLSFEDEQQHISDIEDEQVPPVVLYALQSSIGTKLLKSKDGKPKICIKSITSVISSFHSYKLILGLASAVTIFIAYAAIRGWLVGR